MKRIIILILTLSMAMSCAASAYAGDCCLTADEVKDMYEASVLLSKQDICDKVLNIRVTNTENPLSGKKTAGEYIDPDKAIIIYQGEQYFPEINGVCGVYRVYAWHDEKSLKTKKDIMCVYFSADALETDVPLINSSIEPDFYKRYNYKAGGDPIDYMDFQYTADKINKFEPKDVTAVYYDGEQWELMVTSGGEDYIVIEREEFPPYDTLYGLVKPEDAEKASIEHQQKMDRQYEEWLEKKRSLTPNLSEAEIYEHDIEPTHFLKDYTDAAAPFADLENENAKTIAAVALLKDKGIIEGFEDGTFRPLSPLTRGEAAVILSKLVKDGSHDGNDFPDTENHWSRDAVSYLVSADIIHGYEDGLFRPDKDINYYESVNLVMSVMGATGMMFMDNTMRMAMNEGFLDGLSSFAETSPITRIDFTRLIANAFDIQMYVSKPSFESLFPAVVNLRDITLGAYYDGADLLNGRLFHTADSFLEWQNNYVDEYFTIYDEILDDKLKQSYAEIKASRD